MRLVMARTADRQSPRETSERSTARELQERVFKQKSPRAVAASLKDVVEHSERRKADPYRSAMSTLNFYIRRAGANLTVEEKKKLEKSKEELRDLYNRPSTGRTTSLGRKVERPGEGPAGGPSGQTDSTRDRKHANK